MNHSSNVAPRLRQGPLARLLVATTPQHADNDNGDEEVSDAMLEAALRHFSAHGLSAARAARHKAEQAFFAGDNTAYNWWLGICRLLDRRMAIIAARRIGEEGKDAG